MFLFLCSLSWCSQSCWDMRNTSVDGVLIYVLRTVPYDQVPWEITQWLPCVRLCCVPLPSDAEPCPRSFSLVIYDSLHYILLWDHFRFLHWITCTDLVAIYRSSFCMDSFGIVSRGLGTGMTKSRGTRSARSLTKMNIVVGVVKTILYDPSAIADR